MKKILIIYPHWHPANLAGVHRPRLIGNYLKKFGFTPRVLTVKKEYFEENADVNFEKTFSSEFSVTRVNAFKIGKLRIIGDIGLRAFVQLYREAKNIIRRESIDFIWLPVPSFYNALLGRLLFDKFNVPYGIDYIDPWIRDINNQKNWRSKISQTVAAILEPYAIAKASLVSGVSTPYYEPALSRNFQEMFKNEELMKIGINSNTGLKMTHVSMPYGFDPNDHKIILNDLKLPWGDSTFIKPWIYAGAFLPNSHLFIKCFFKAVDNLRQNKMWDNSVRLFFIGTGPYPAKRITAYANDFGLDDIVVEHRERRSYLEVLNLLSKSDRVMLFGSTEKHYTASKTFQCLLSERPLLSVLHNESSAVKVIKEVGADDFLIEYSEKQSPEDITNNFIKILGSFQKEFNWDPNLELLNKYSAEESTNKFVNALKRINI